MKIHWIKNEILIFARRLLNQAGIRHKRKVFAVGFNKSGTTSLHALLKSLGLPSYHGEKWRACDDMNLLRSYDCFMDDIPEDLAKLDEMFPDSKFILQVRELDRWVYSRLAHIERKKAQNAHNPHPIWDTTVYAVKSWIKKRNEYHLFVLSYFTERSSDLLVVNITRDESAATKICNFLGYEGKYEMPRKNVHLSRKHCAKHEEMLRESILEFGIPERELRYDIYCPSLVSNETQGRFPVDSSMLDTFVE